MAKVVAVNISQHKGTFKSPVPEGHATVDHGLAGDATRATGTGRSACWPKRASIK